jgi:hypothetical protein
VLLQTHVAPNKLKDPRVRFGCLARMQLVCLLFPQLRRLRRAAALP